VPAGTVAATSTWILVLLLVTLAVIPETKLVLSISKILSVQVVPAVKSVLIGVPSVVVTVLGVTVISVGVGGADCGFWITLILWVSINPGTVIQGITSHSTSLFCPVVLSEPADISNEWVPGF
jgi:hypothetical protein